MGKFREFELSTGKIVFLGKDAVNNDLLVSSANPLDFLIHTAAPGSPFCNVGEKPIKKEIKEAAIFTALKSQIWRDSKSDVVVHIFKKADVFKDNKMKAGSWEVKRFSELKIKKVEILKCVE